MRKNLVLIFLNEEHFKILYNGNYSVVWCDTIVIIILKELESTRLGDRKIQPLKNWKGGWCGAYAGYLVGGPQVRYGLKVSWGRGSNGRWVGLCLRSASYLPWSFSTLVPPGWWVMFAPTTELLEGEFPASCYYHGTAAPNGCDQCLCLQSEAQLSLMFLGCSVHCQ